MDGFIFYASFYNAIKDLPDDSQLRLYQAIMKFALEGEELTNLTKFEKGIFTVIKPQILANQKRYKNGLKGGRPKKETNGIETEKPTENEKENHRLSKEKTNGYENEKPMVIKTENLNRNKNININRNNKKEIEIKRENIKEKKLAVVEPTALTPQAEVYEFFAKLYKREPKIDYLAQKVDYINLSKLIKNYGKELVMKKIMWLLMGCQHSVFWFSKDINDFNISTLYTQWNYILPKLTEQQKKEQDKKRKEEEDRQRVKEELAKQGIVFEEEGGNNAILQ